jgi:mono/diheme cytochrome c family protein
MKQSALFFFVAVFLYACGGGNNDKSIESLQPTDDGKGYGEITEVKLNETLNQDMVERGRAIYDMKCSACHKLSAQRVVGPGWAGLTEKRKPEWIMNMITNVDIMLEKDPTAQKLLEECLTRMPNQNVSVGDARDLLEFIYQNDLDQKEKS